MSKCGGGNVERWFDGRMKWVLGEGYHCRFWLVNSIGDERLIDRYPRLAFSSIFTKKSNH